MNYNFLSDDVGPENLKERIERFRNYCETSVCSRSVIDTFALLTARDYISFLENKVEHLERTVNLCDSIIHKMQGLK